MQLKKFAFLFVAFLNLCSCQRQTDEWRLKINSIAYYNIASQPQIDRWGNLSLTDTYAASLSSELERVWWVDSRSRKKHPLLEGSKVHTRALFVMPTEEASYLWETLPETLDCIGAWKIEAEIDPQGNISLPLALHYLFAQGPKLESTLHLVLEVQVEDESIGKTQPQTLLVPFTPFDRKQVKAIPMASPHTFNKWSRTCGSMRGVPTPLQNQMGNLSVKRGTPMPSHATPFSLYLDSLRDSGRRTKVIEMESLGLESQIGHRLKKSMAHYLEKLFPDGRKAEFNEVEKKQRFSPLARKFCALLYNQEFRESCLGVSPLDWVEIEALEFLDGAPQILDERHDRSNLQLMASFLIEDTHSLKYEVGNAEREEDSSGNQVKPGGLGAFEMGFFAFSTWTQASSEYIAVGTANSRDNKNRSRIRDLEDFTVQKKILELEAPVRQCLRIGPTQESGASSVLFCRNRASQRLTHRWYYINDSDNFEGFLQGANDRRKNRKWTTLIRSKEEYEKFRHILSNSIVRLLKRPAHYQRTQALYREFSANNQRSLGEIFPNELGPFPGVITQWSTRSPL